MPASPTTNLLVVRSVTVDGNIMSWRTGRELKLGPFPRRVTITFGPSTNSDWAPRRLSYKLEGYDSAWRKGRSDVMNFNISFYDDALDIIGKKEFPVEGDSIGWNGSLQTSTLTHRRETILIPPRASRLVAVISSAGPPAAVGIFVIDNLIVSRISSNSPPQILIGNLFDIDAESGGTNELLEDWQRSGTAPSMAKIVEIGQDPKKKALAILDDDPIGHAEWHNRIATAPRVSPGDLVVVEWNELFSIGLADVSVADYQTLPPGPYRFCIREENIMGVPTSAETSLAILVPLPLWKQTWFWVTAATVLVAASATGVRSVASRRMKREVLRLEQQRVLEQERLRIAQNIHDDLGARVTQISMLSAMAPDRSTFPQNARADFNQISQMSRDLVSALYETVWAVNPENDNLYAMGNYLRQMTSQLCESAQLRCRFDIPILPREVQVSSQTRHNVAMVVKEAVHNIMKHAHASELTIRVDFTELLLTVSIRDDGRGFQASGLECGNGLANMKRRMEDLGGSCVVESQPGGGTSVYLRLRIKAAQSDRSQKPSPPASNGERSRREDKA